MGSLPWGRLRVLGLRTLAKEEMGKENFPGSGRRSPIIPGTLLLGSLEPAP
jgi:hypothetical protein